MLVNDVAHVNEIHKQILNYFPIQLLLFNNQTLDDKITQITTYFISIDQYVINSSFLINVLFFYHINLISNFYIILIQWFLNLFSPSLSSFTFDFLMYLNS